MRRRAPVTTQQESPSAKPTEPAASVGVEPEAERRKQARLRAAAMRCRLRLANDALAAADLLLGMNASIGSLGQRGTR